MSADDIQLARPTDPQLRGTIDRLEQSLIACFPAGFGLFIWHDQWQLIGNSDILPHIADEVAHDAGRSLKSIENATYAILPFSSNRDVSLLVVACVEEGTTEPQLELVGNLVQQNLATCEEIESTSQEQEESTRLVAFTKDLIRALESGKPNQSFADTAARILTILSSTIHAESIALVPKGTSSPADFVAVGNALGDRFDWERIVDARQKIDPNSLVFRSFSGVDFSEIRDFVVFPVRQAGRMLGWLAADADEAKASSDSFLQSILAATAAILANQAVNEERVSEKEVLLLDVIRSLVSAIDTKDIFACGHSARVAKYASLVASELGLSRRECDEVYLSGLLHDVGKIGVPDRIFEKNRELTQDEYRLVQQHPDHGWKILQRLEDRQHLLPGVLHHHERFDGTGYPDKIAGEEIPLVARILAAVDAYDALRSDRPYRKGISHEKALEILLEGAETQWDPDVIDALVCMSKKIERISRTHRSESHLWRVPGMIAPQDNSGERSDDFEENLSLMSD